ncbi:EF-hand calcium-binding domain-containing protein 12 [Frankliniella fusca]|uniref:EF-hand calcium-binding domain-containing protein 12 n=1 Tax=Frankliniella fusca TaxID=407009 RepID=A0AAE1GTM6_9NEOP|nr:EF-hand calcium-binding domain-containing protein 12 [Frankliniella fusca]
MAESGGLLFVLFCVVAKANKPESSTSSSSSSSSMISSVSGIPDIWVVVYFSCHWAPNRPSTYLTGHHFCQYLDMV